MLNSHAGRAGTFVYVILSPIPRCRTRRCFREFPSLCYRYHCLRFAADAVVAIAVWDVDRKSVPIVEVGTVVRTIVAAGPRQRVTVVMDMLTIVAPDVTLGVDAVLRVNVGRRTAAAPAGTAEQAVTRVRRVVAPASTVVESVTAVDVDGAC